MTRRASGYAYYVLAVLVLVYVFSFVDRYILSILLESIKQELGASDTQMGVLTGFLFALFYTTFGLPVARWADRGTRRTIIAIGLAVWSAMTAISGLARSFVHLALARFGVGMGEAASNPPSHSLISDYFPPDRRATAFGIYAMGSQGGHLIAFLVGGLLNELYGWRMTLIAVGLPGLLLAVLVRATVAEPPRGQMDEGPAHPEPTPTSEAVAFLASQRSFVHMNIASSFHASIGYGFGIWLAPFLMRVHQLGSADTGQALGLIGLAGIAGNFVGGRLTDRLARDDGRWYMWVPAFAAFVSPPLSVAFLLAPSLSSALLFYSLFLFLTAMYPPGLFVGMQTTSRLRMRALAVGLHLFAVNLLGLGLGPVAVGMMNDALHARFGEEAVRYSLLGIGVLGFFAGAFYLIAARSIRSDMLRAAEES